jgi:hypothetical protein
MGGEDVASRFGSFQQQALAKNRCPTNEFAGYGGILNPSTLSRALAGVGCASSGEAKATTQAKARRSMQF